MEDHHKGNEGPTTEQGSPFIPPQSPEYSGHRPVCWSQGVVTLTGTNLTCTCKVYVEQEFGFHSVGLCLIWDFFFHLMSVENISWPQKSVLTT